MRSGSAAREKSEGSAMPSVGISLHERNRLCRLHCHQRGTTLARVRSEYVLVGLTESGVNPEALAAVVKAVTSASLIPSRAGAATSPASASESDADATDAADIVRVGAGVCQVLAV